MKDGQASPPKGQASPQNDESMIIQELKGIIEQQKNIIEMLTNVKDSKLVETKDVKVIQINSGKKSYFCKPEELQGFKNANPTIKIDETFSLELPPHIAEEYLNGGKDD